MTATREANSVAAGLDAKAWIDLVSPSHPFFFAALVSALPGLDTTVTVRSKTETVSLAEAVGFDFSVIGRDFDDPHLRKVGIPLRTAQLAVRMPSSDVALASRNAMCVLAAKARNVPVIHYTDNDITAHVDGLTAERLYNKFEAMATHSIVPAAFEAAELTRHGAAPESIHTYDGTKEDVYVATFEPDPTVPATVPFAADDYVVVRPEALSAAYVDADESLVPELLAGLVDDGEHVVYLPRGRDDEAYAEAVDDTGVFVPDGAVNGLQLCWHARCVLTGSGTMAREAAAMDVPAVSFFPGPLLSVDSALVSDGAVFHSRDVDEIRAYVSGRSAADVVPSRDQSRQVRDEVVELTASIIDDETSG